MHYNRHRYYDAQCGLFISQDPIGLRGGLNVYQYAPNTLSWVDPLGLESFLAKALKLGRKIPAGMSNPHGHHIVFKGAFTNNPDMRAELDRSIRVLNKYGITDIVNEPSNLMIANNGPGVHTVENAKKVADKLEEVDKEISEKLKGGIIDQATANKQMQCQLLKIGDSVFGHYR